MQRRKGTQFTVTLANRPGTLGEVTKLFADKNYNVLALSCETLGDVGLARFIVEAEERAVQKLLEQAGYKPNACPVFLIELPNKPGQIHHVCQTLGGKGVNISAAFFTACGSGPATVVLAADQAEKAWSALEKELAGAAS